MFKKRKIAKSQIFINLGFETRVWLSDQSELGVVEILSSSFFVVVSILEHQIWSV